MKGFIIAPDGSACSQGILQNGLDISIFQPNCWWSPASYSQDAIFRITRPVIKLISLCHRDNFPLPRFALGLHDLAKVIRSGGFGQVSLFDMQLGDTINSMVQGCIEDQVDIVGVSVTFGQHDLLEDLLKKLVSTHLKITIVVGGSLASLNSKEILRQFPQVIVAKSEGEATICDVVKFWRKECSIHDINDIEFVNKNQFTINKASIRQNRDKSHVDSPPSFEKSVLKKEPEFILRSDNTKRLKELPLPELDLLPRTLSSHGVMLLESSRGCSFTCSFCPREHKGNWYATKMSGFHSFLGDLGKLFDEHPEINRKIFFIDEEFFGYYHDAEKRVLNLATALSNYGFHFETSTRLDKVFRPCKTIEWHINRLKLWKQLVKLGMDRCLFGVESGVNSVLQRFQKKITSEQNVTAIRLLSLAKIPVRFTYITFDPLMTMSELIETYRFQGRTDFWLDSTLNDDITSMVSIALDDTASNNHDIGIPLYETISYMLVSLECLIGSKYLERVKRFGHPGAPNYLMGRQDVKYSNPIIGILSKHAQMWVDRNFALDYTFKSLLKVMEPSLHPIVMKFRKILKSYAYRFLGIMLVIANNDLSLEANIGDSRSAIEQATKAGWTENYSIDCLNMVLPQVMDWLFDKLSLNMESSFLQNALYLDTVSHRLIEKQLTKWGKSVDWKLIN